ncbi:hypothetical protein RA996_22255 [Mycobacteroides abscessus subsp. abscessus]|uniref:hypothetical protein n=1 Tax=Mycobacteroides abscessus TaxID=36809 RepID=UPI00266BAB4F|nr:hypothetical protein [Mycobacteroides abscessus]MDO3146420.1 hypothetical protein [Mycobacteroides abscessus subsp. abscessus]
MSDEPSDAQKLIAEVAAPLLYIHRVIGKNCTCGENVTLPSDSWYARHMGEVLAVEVDKALGVLTREWGVQMIGYDEVTVGSEGTALYCARKHPKRWNALSRFVSGWTVTE